MQGDVVPVQPGDVLAGKYEVVGVIGHGGMGIVYEAKHKRLGQRVAIKVLQVDVAFLPEAVQRFEREARAAAKLTSVNVARVRDVDNLADGRPFMVMEYLEGHDLDDELGRRGRFEIREAVDYVLQVCMGMAEAHSLGIVHRDLKPHNLFLTYRGGKPCIKVLDFGVSKLVEDSAKAVTVTATSLGTPQYMSPEQIRSAKHVDVRSDIWALGIILYELLSGDLPFAGDSPTAMVAAITADAPVPLSERRPEVPPQLAGIVMKAIEKNPIRRFPDVQAFAELLVPFGTPGTWQPTDEPAHAGVAFDDSWSSSTYDGPYPLASEPSHDGGIDAEASYDTLRSEPGFVHAPTQRMPAQTAATWATDPGKARLGRRAQLAIAGSAIVVLGAAVFLGVRFAGSSESVTTSAPGASAEPASSPEPTTAAEPPSTADEAPPPEPESTADAAAPSSEVSSKPSRPPAPPPRPRPRPTSKPPATTPAPKPTAPSGPENPIHL